MTTISKIMSAVLVAVIAITITSCGVSKNSYNNDPEYAEYLQQKKQSVAAKQTPEKEVAELQKRVKSNKEIILSKDEVVSTETLSEDEKSTISNHIRADESLNKQKIVAVNKQIITNTKTGDKKIIIDLVSESYRKLTHDILLNGTLTTRTNNIGIEFGYGQELRLAEKSPVNIFWNIVGNYETGEIEDYTFDQYGLKLRAGLLFFKTDNNKINLRLGGMLGWNKTKDLRHFDEHGIYDIRWNIMFGPEAEFQAKLCNLGGKTSLWANVKAGYYYSKFKVVDMVEATDPWQEPPTKQNWNTASPQINLGLVLKF